MCEYEEKKCDCEAEEQWDISRVRKLFLAVYHMQSDSQKLFFNQEEENECKIELCDERND